jgi:hypothetical protein
MWACFDYRLTDHPQVAAASSELGPDGSLLTLGALVTLLLWSSRHGTRGHIPAALPKPLSITPQILHALLKAELLKRVTDGYEVQQTSDIPCWATRDRNPSPRRRGGVDRRKRFQCFERDEFTCQYCGRRAPDVELEVDHIVPVTAGGLDTLDNLITACVECNGGKAHRPLQADVSRLHARIARPNQKSDDFRP